MTTLVHAVAGPYLNGMDSKQADAVADEVAEEPAKLKPAPVLPKEIGGVEGPEPTRYGDWQHKGRGHRLLR